MMRTSYPSIPNENNIQQKENSCMKYFSPLSLILWLLFSSTVMKTFAQQTDINIWRHHWKTQGKNINDEPFSSRPYQIYLNYQMKEAEYDWRISLTRAYQSTIWSLNLRCSLYSKCPSCTATIYWKFFFGRWSTSRSNLHQDFTSNQLSCV